MEVEESIIRRCVCQILRQFDYKTKEINSKSLKELVGTIRRTDVIIPSFVDILFEHLRQKDCDVRLCILHISGYFFQRSHNFRLELINAIQDFLVYTLEADPIHYPMPGPSDAADLLKKETITMLRCWIDKFGLGYQKLQALGNYLSKSKSLDWKNFNSTSQIERDRAELETFKQQVHARKVVEKITKLFEESRADIEQIQVEAFQLSELLFPNFCPLNNKDQVDNTLQGTSEFTANNQSVSILPSSDVIICLKEKVEIEKTDDNVDLINQLTETTKQLEKWNNNITNWIKKLTQVGNYTNTSTTSLIKRLIDTKRSLSEELQKCKEFRIKGSDTESDSSDTEDEEFLDVDCEKEGYEPEMFQFDSAEREKDDSFICSTIPGTSSDNKIPKDFAYHHQCPLKSQNNKDEITKNQPPCLAMDLDLCYWGEKMSNNKSQRICNEVAEDCWWRKYSENDNDNDTHGNHDEKSYIPRQMTFVGELPILRKMCRAPLKSGKLCPQMEHNHCALHGPIIDRDEQGFPVEEQLITNSDANRKAGDKKKAEDEAYLHDIEATTGMKLAGKTSKSSSNKCNKTARTRMKQIGILGRERIKTKLFDKRALKRVSDTLVQIQRAKTEQKFLIRFGNF